MHCYLFVLEEELRNLQPSRLVNIIQYTSMYIGGNLKLCINNLMNRTFAG